jgi:hypothetical protein
MPNARIGALRVDLGLNSAAFEKGLDLMQRRMAGVQKNLQGVAERMSKIGQSITIGISAPLAAMGGAVLSSARDIAAGIPEMEKLAKLSNVSAQEFQKLAYAAKAAGLDGDKLGDIFKDVNDKIGDFAATGGGEMKAFFDNIAPKVGITAEAFKGLSGPQALQLYYNSLERAGVSQAEMTFYLEAIADDAAALIPLLAQNGAEFERLGKKAAVMSEADLAAFKEYTDASNDMQQSFQKLTVALVRSGVIDAITIVATKVSEITASLAKTNPEILKWGVAIGGVGVALGPVLMALGGMVSGISAALPVLKGLWTGLSALPAILMTVGRAFTAMLGPIGWVALAVGAAYAVWENWDTIGPIVKNVYTAVKTWVWDKLNAIWDGVKKRIEAVKGYFYDLYDAVVGNSYVPDMVDGIADQMARLEGVMVKPSADATNRTSQAFEAMAQRVRGILDRLFPEARVNLDFSADKTALEALVRAGKITEQQFTEAMRRLLREYHATISELDNANVQAILPVTGDEIPQMFADNAFDWGTILDGMRDKAETTSVQIAESFRDMANRTLESFSQLANSIKSGGFLGILESVIGLGLQLGSVGVFGKKVQASLNKVPGRAVGGPVKAASTYLVGEKGPELFTSGVNGRIIPNDRMGGGGRPIMFDLRGAVLTEDLLRQMNTMAAQATVQGGQLGADLAQARGARSNLRRVR